MEAAKEKNSPVEDLRVQEFTDDGASLPFIVQTGHHSAKSFDARSRRLVRSQARKSAHRSRHLDGLSSSSGSPIGPRQSANTGNVVSQQSLKSKFKLSSWQPRQSKKDARFPCSANPSVSSSLVLSTLQRLSEFPQSVPAELRPINALPIPLPPTAQRILHFCHVDFPTNKFSLNPEGNWYSIARTDSGLLNAFLSTAAVFRNLHFGINDLEAVVHHRYEAIRFINQQLNSKPGNLSVELVTAVAVLVTAEALENNFDRALVHMGGLVKVVGIHGGLTSFDNSPTLQRVITWADFSFSATWGIPLSFPLLKSISRPLIPSQWSVQERLQHYAASRLPNNPEPKLSLLGTLSMFQDISQQISSFPSIGGNATAIGNTIYVAEYHLLTLLFPRDNPEIKCDSDRLFCLAILLYSFLAIREMPLHAPRHYKLIERLSRCLHHYRELSMSPDSKFNEYIRLWVLFIGAVVSKEFSTRSYALRSISKINSAIGITNYEAFVSNLKGVLWVDKFCLPHCIPLWEDLKLYSHCNI